MALKLTLKPQERMILGGAVVTNGNTKCDLIIENSVPILREKDILSEAQATTPCTRIYFAVQLMYVDEQRLAEHHKLYWDLVRDVVRAAPSTLELVDQMSEHILCGRYYQALKAARQLIEYEEEVTRNVHSAVGSL